MEKSTKTEVERLSASFVINFNEKDDTKPKNSKNLPKFVSRTSQSEKKSLTREDLERKQKEAFERKEKLKKAKIARIQERSEECRKVDEKVQILLEQDAIRRQMPGSEKFKPMSKSEISKVVKGVAKDLEQISKNLQCGDEIPNAPKS